MLKQSTILIAEDDPRMLKLVRRTLELEGYQAVTASDGRQALDLANSEDVDLIILDVMMPEMDGFTVAQQIRANSRVPILMLTARAAEADIVQGLDAGADDYLLKPFGADELAARVRALLRRAGAQEGPKPPTVVVIADELSIDLAQRRVHRGDQEILLTPTEYRLLALLAAHRGKILTHEMLLEQVWGPQWGTELHQLRVYVARLRQKIESDPANPRFLLTRPGFGYTMPA
ncbi:MAG TPA: response regulator transcription factor [Chloroflexia bacterium]|nr:response regulator transcription factor [Chloroflexia bacterium]